MNIQRIAQEHLRKEIMQFLDSTSISTDAKEHVHKLLVSDVTGKVYSSLNTKYKLEKFVMDNFPFVRPQELKMDDQIVGHYMSITATIGFLLEDRTFQLTEEKSPDGIFRYARDSHLYRQSTYLKNNPDAITINLYSDALQLSNPLGAAKNKHSILCVYFTLNDMPLWQQSAISQIFNVAFVDHKKHGSESVEVLHRKLVQELLQLEKGVLVKGKQFKVTVHTYLGDNLEIHQMSGLQSWFNSGYICRKCIITHQQLKQNLSTVEQRTEEMYAMVMQKLPDVTLCDDVDEEEMDVIHEPGESNEEIEEFLQEVDNESQEDDNESEEVHDESQEVDNESNYGWLKPCIYNKLMNFHVLQSLPFDILHDCMEGLFSYDVPCILKYYFNKKELTIEALNKSLLNFNYSPDEIKDKPAPFQNKNFNRLPGKGMASSLLVKILPYILQPIVTFKRDCEIWEMLKLLHRIRELVLADSFNQSLISEFERVIESYFQFRRNNEQSFVNLKPKHHYMMHISENIMLHGPPIRNWTARHESKHIESKSMVQCSRNFRNLTYSLAMKGSFRLASHLYNGLQSRKYIQNFGRWKEKQDVIKEYDDMTIPNLMNDDTKLVEYVNYKNTIYKKGNRYHYATIFLYQI